MLLRCAAALTCALLFASCAQGGPAAITSPAPPSASVAAGGSRAPTASPAPTRPPQVPLLTPVVVQSGLRIPWDVAFAPDGRMFVTERAGNILIFASGEPNAPRVGHTSVTNMRAVDEAGLMGIALDPDFAANGLVYVCASRVDEGEWRNQVLRYRASGNSLEFDRYVIQRGIRASNLHDGCRVRFGPDGKLWISMGDAAVGRSAQDPNALNGRLLRIERDGGVPSDNPILAGAAARTAAYTMGNRNPQGIAFEPGTGRVFEIEHGEDTEDEINLVEPGANYGWPIVEGPAPGRGFRDPLWSSGPGTLATSGGTFVTGAAWGTWAGSLMVCTLKEADLRRFTVDGTTVLPAEVLFDNRFGRLRSPVLAPDGSLYLTTSNGSGDRIIRVTPAQP